MKRLIPVILSLLLLLTACGDPDASETTGAGSESTETYSNEGPEGVLEDKDTVTVYLLARVNRQSTNGFGSLQESGHIEYEYDETGFCVAEYEYDPDGAIFSQTLYTADENGRVGQSTAYPFFDPSAPNTSQAYIQDYTYDEAGRVIRLELSQNHELVETQDYTYDDHGNQLTMLTTNEMGESLQTYEYTYDENGNVLSCHGYADGELFSWSEMTYDEAGREVCAIHYDSDGTELTRTESSWEGSTVTQSTYVMGDAEASHVSVITYDDRGNMTYQEERFGGLDDPSIEITEYIYEPFEVKR